MIMFFKQSPVFFSFFLLWDPFRSVYFKSPTDFLRFFFQSLSANFGRSRQITQEGINLYFSIIIYTKSVKEKFASKQYLRFQKSLETLKNIID